VGDRVAIEPLYRCDRCGSCRAGFYHLCDSLAFHGLAADGGGLSEYTIVQERMVHRLPPSVSLDQGALVEPLAVCRHAIRRAGVKSGDKVVIHGGGPIGLGLVLTLYALGVDQVAVVEPSEARLQNLQAVGATTIIDPAHADVLESIRGFAGAPGADVSFDAAGVEAA
jgi:(R,R)-butanediol dehydrogenase/meso-butanediol dehydrogenase/diacetyl reductase